MSETKTCERCGAEEPEVGYRIQPFIIAGAMRTIRGVFCHPCAAAFAESSNWVIRGNTLSFDPKERDER